MSQDKDEILRLAHEADDTIRSKPFTAEMLSFLERFSALCRADLVPVVEQLVQALCELVQSDGLPRTLEQLDASVKKAFAAIAAGQTFIKESKHA